MSGTPLGRFWVDFGLNFGCILGPKINKKKMVFSKLFFEGSGTRLANLFLLVFWSLCKVKKPRDFGRGAIAREMRKPEKTLCFPMKSAGSH